MPPLFGRNIGKHDLLVRAGDLSEVAGIRMMTLADGAEQGVRIADVRTGSSSWIRAKNAASRCRSAWPTGRRRLRR